MGVVSEALSGDIELSMGRHDRGVLDGLIRSWRSADVQGREAIAAEFRDMLGADDIKRRSAAVLFFEAVPADDGGALFAALQERPEQFMHHPDPWFGRGELRVLLAVAMSRRISDTTRDAVRYEARRPHLGHCVLPGLLDGDRAWALEHVTELVTASPDALAVYVEGVTDDELEAVVRQARGALPADVFEGVLHNTVRSEQRRQAALAL